MGRQRQARLTLALHEKTETETKTKTKTKSRGSRGIRRGGSESRQYSRVCKPITLAKLAQSYSFWTSTLPPLRFYPTGSPEFTAAIACCRADTPLVPLANVVEKPIDSRSARPPCRPGVDSVSRRLARRTYIARRGRRCAAEWNGELFELSALLANVHGGLLCR